MSGNNSVYITLISGSNAEAGLGIGNLASLHIIEQMEKSLQCFEERGGQFGLVFFQTNLQLLVLKSHQLLRSIVIKHFQSNSKTLALTEFSSPFDPKYCEWVEREEPVFILSSVSSLQDSTKQPLLSLFFQQHLSLGLNFAEYSDIVKTIDTIEASYCNWGPPRSPQLTAALLDQYKAMDSLEDLSNDFVVLSLENGELAVEENSREYLSFFPEADALMRSVFLAGEVTKKHCTLSERIEIGISYGLTDESGFMAISEQICQTFLQKGTNKVPLKQLTGLIDNQLLLRTLYRLGQGEGDRELKDVFSTEIEFHPEIRTEFEELGANKVDVSKHSEILSNIVKIENKQVDDTKGLKKIRHPLYEEFTKSVVSEVVEDHGDVELSLDHFKVFEERHHWHVLKPLTDQYDRTPEQTAQKGFWGQKSEQQKASFMSRYGTSIEGSIETGIIVANDPKAKKSKKDKDAGKTSTKSLQIQRDNIKDDLKAVKETIDKRVDVVLKNFETNWDVNLIEKELDFVKSKRGEIEIKLRKVGGGPEEEKDKKKKAPKGKGGGKGKGAAPEDNLAEDIKEYFDGRIFKLVWKLLGRLVKLEKSSDGDENVVKIMLNIKELLPMEAIKKDKNQEKLSSFLAVLGFYELGANLGFKMTEETNKRSFARFQLEKMGAKLDHDGPKDRDKRVEKFIPDLWQRELFDVVDKRGSALIIAPTSSGKTYASYYCMESVLR